MMKALLDLDRYLFEFFNSRLSNPFFDSIMPVVRNADTWLPLYLFLLVLIIVNFKKSGWIILFAVLTVILTDALSSHLIKNLIFRIRPCGDPSMIGHVRFLVIYCPQSSSFTSSHATNHFGFATIMAGCLYPYLKRWVYVGFFWAALISFAQIYVGVHYPIDVLAGTIVGILSGWLMAKLFKKIVGDPELIENTTIGATGVASKRQL